MYPLVWKNATSNDKVVQSTEVCYSGTILIHVSECVDTSHIIIGSVVSSHLDIGVPPEDGDVFLIQVV